MIYAKWILLMAATMIMAGPVAYAADEIETAEQEALNDKSIDWNTAVKTKYELTDEQIAAMRAKGLNDPQMAFTAQLAKSSGKTIDEVMQMRVDQKMGWGKIAKELGVHPSELGKSVSSLRKERRSNERAAHRDERKAERMADRALRKEERKAARAERKEKKDAAKKH